ncbi:hypothetical protein [Francisella sp. TX07-6608]|nr:hypothetical protein [Francisella sp. TX07-6608]OIN84249.1 putative lipoprotein [Francisella sp. TX07-6608]
MQKFKSTSKASLILGLGTTITILGACSNNDKNNVDPLGFYNKQNLRYV